MFCVTEKSPRRRCCFGRNDTLLMPSSQVGASGREQWHNGFCVLSQNVINEKIYLALWFYLVFTMVCCLVFMFYRTATIFVEPLR